MAQATEQAQAAVSNVAGQAQDKAQQAAGQARNQLQQQVDQRSTDAGEQIKTVADAIRGTTDQLREQGQHKPADLVERAAGKAEEAGNWLQRSDADQILSDVEDFARRQPWAVVAGGIVAGFAAARFLKASSAKRYESYQTRSSRPYHPSTGTSSPTPGAGFDNGGGNGQTVAGQLPSYGDTTTAQPGLGTVRPIPPAEPGLGSTGGL